MQNYNILQPATLISVDRATINNNFESVSSNFSGNYFPTQNLVENMFCFRTDLHKLYQYSTSPNPHWNLVLDMTDGVCMVQEATHADKATNDENGNKISTTYAAKTGLLAELMNEVYPVGSIYITAVNKNPGTFLGGTWQQIASGRTLIGAGAGYNVGNTGGSATISYTPSGSVGNHKLTLSEIPTHKHNNTVSISNASAGAHRHFVSSGSSDYKALKADNYLAKSFDTESSVFDVYTLKGTNTDATIGRSSSAGAHSHNNTVSITNANAGESGNHNHGFTGSSATLNVMQPYLVVYYWQRIL